MGSLPKADWFVGVFLINKITRYIATLKASEGGYINLPQLVNIGASQTFELEFNASSSELATYFVAKKSDINGENRIVFNGVGAFFGCGVDGAVPTDTSWLTNGFVNNVIFSRGSDGFFTITVNGMQVLRDNRSQGTSFEFDSLFSKWDGSTSSNNLNGSPLLFKCTIDGELKHHYLFDVVKGTTIIPNLAQPLGDELWNGYIEGVLFGAVGLGINEAQGARTTNWMSLVDGTKTILVRRSNSTRCRVQYSFDNLTSAGEVIELSANPDEALLSVPANATNVRIYYGNPSDVNPTISIKAANNWAEYINVTDDNKELYTFDSERNAWISNDAGKILEVAQ